MAQGALRLEGWDEHTDVFSPDTICNIEGEPWSANNSVPKLLFRDKEKFEKVFPEFKLEKFEVTECLLFLCSGGVNFKCWHPNFSKRGCSRIKKIDHFLVALLPEIFALGCKVVIEKDESFET